MSDLISRESLKQRINLNYNNHQYIDTQSIKDIINTEPSVEDKTVEELENIKDEIKDLDLGFFDEDYRAGVARGIMEFNKILNKHIVELKGE